MRSLLALPKTDLHVHFQGSARATSVRVLDVVRGFPLDLARPTVDTALRFAGQGVVALARAGVEAAFLDPRDQDTLIEEITTWLADVPDPLQEPSR